MKFYIRDEAKRILNVGILITNISKGNPPYNGSMGLENCDMYSKLKILRHIIRKFPAGTNDSTAKKFTIRVVR